MWVWMLVAEIARSLRLHWPTPREIDKTVGTTFIHSCAFLQQLTGASLAFHCGVLCNRKRHPNRCQSRALDCVSRASHWFFKGKHQGYMCVV